MSIQLPTRQLSILIGKIPIRIIFIVPFVAQILIAVGVTGWLSFDNGQSAVNDLAAQLRNEITARIGQQLDTFLTAPRVASQMNADAIRLGQLDLDDLRSWQPYLYHQSQLFNAFELIYFGSEKGEYVGLQRKADNPLEFEIMTDLHPGVVQEYVLDDQGRPADEPKGDYNYDPRVRPWYIAAVQAGQPTWSDIYQYCPTPVLGVTFGHPYYDETGTLQGVLAIDFTLKNLSDYLGSLKIGQTGKTFIIDHSGLLVASSSDVPFTDDTLRTSCGEDNAEGLKLSVLDSKDTLIQPTAQFLHERFGSFSLIDQSYQLDFELEGARQLVQVTPYSDESGIDWLIAVVIPEADFMEQINANIRVTLLLMLLALVGAIGIGILTARWITQPILSLNSSAKALAKGQLAAKSPG